MKTDCKPRPKTLMEVFCPKEERKYTCNVIGYSGDVEAVMTLVAESEAHARAKLASMGVDMYSDLTEAS